MPFRGTAFALLPVHLSTSKLKKENLERLVAISSREICYLGTVYRG